MTKYALLGLRFRNRAAAEFPIPGKLHTADKAWFEQEEKAVDERMKLDFFWDRSNSAENTINRDDNIWSLFAKDKAEKVKKWYAKEAEKAAQAAMKAERERLGLPEPEEAPAEAEKTEEEIKAEADATAKANYEKAKAKRKSQ